MAKNVNLRSLNISLPTKLSTKIDEIVETGGYASRSEFIRTLLRFYIHSPTSKPTFFLPFKKQPLNKIKNDLADSGLYNQRFIESVIKWRVIFIVTDDKAEIIDINPHYHY